MAFCLLERKCGAALQEAGEVYVIGAGDCGQLGVGEDDVEALRARLSSVASGMKVCRGFSLCAASTPPKWKVMILITHSTSTLLGLHTTLARLWAQGPGVSVAERQVSWRQD